MRRFHGGRQCAIAIAPAAHRKLPPQLFARGRVLRLEDALCVRLAPLSAIQTFAVATAVCIVVSSFLSALLCHRIHQFADSVDLIRTVSPFSSVKESGGTMPSRSAERCRREKSGHDTGKIASSSNGRLICANEVSPERPCASALNLNGNARLRGRGSSRSESRVQERNSGCRPSPAADRAGSVPRYRVSSCHSRWCIPRSGARIDQQRQLRLWD